MKLKIRVGMILLSLIFAGVGNLHAESLQVQVKDAWVRAMPPVSKVTAGYMIIENSSDADIKLVGVVSGDAEVVEMHEMGMTDDGVMTMQQLDQIVIPAKGSVVLKPGGLHLMLINPVKVFKVSDLIKLELIFDNGESVVVDAVLKNDDEEKGSMHHM